MTSTAYDVEIVALLSADALLASLLPGGVYLFPSSGRKGLNRIQIPGAFDPQVGLLKPIAMVYEAREEPTGEAVHMPMGYLSTVTPESVLIYAQGDPDADGVNPYTIIRNAHDRIKALLHGQQIDGAFQILYKDVIRNKREPNLKDAAYWMAMYDVHGWTDST